MSDEHKVALAVYLLGFFVTFGRVVSTRARGEHFGALLFFALLVGCLVGWWLAWGVAFIQWWPATRSPWVSSTATTSPRTSSKETDR